MLTLSNDAGSSTSPHVNGLSEYDERVTELGAIPYRLMHPGEECSVTRGAQEVVCGTDEGIELEAPSSWVSAVTSMFMHGGWLHLIFNMLFLWVFGRNVENRLGRIRFLLFYLAAGLAAVYGQSALHPDSTVPTIGASGAIAGVLGAYLLLYPRARIVTLIIIIFLVTVIEVPAMIMLGIWFALQFIPAIADFASVEVADEGGVAYLAHVGGFLFGLAAIKVFLLGRPDPRLGIGRRA